jgi:hypothetical protein
MPFAESEILFKHSEKFISESRKCKV